MFTLFGNHQNKFNTNILIKKTEPDVKDAILTQVINQTPVDSFKFDCSSKIGFTFVIAN